MSYSAVSQTDTLRLENFHDLTIKDTGNIVVETTYSYGLNTSESCTCRAIHHFHLGKRNGVSKRYCPNGKVKLEENFKDSKREGAYNLYDCEGRPINYMLFKNEKEIVDISYYPSGIKQVETERDTNGTIIYAIMRDETGKIKYSQYNNADSTITINYFDNEKIKDEKILIKKTNEHLDKLWDKEGRVLEDRKYIQIGETDSHNDDHYYVRDEKGKINKYVYVSQDSTVITTYYDNGEIEFRRLRIIKTKTCNEKLWDKKGRLLKERSFTYYGSIISNMNETIYRPDIIKRNPQYKEWKYKLWEL